MKKFFFITLVTVLMLFAVSVSVSAATVASGSCGANATWTLDDTGTMTISGSGAMTDYETEADRPWNDYIHTIRKLVVENRITTIGMGAFAYAPNLTEVSLPNTITSIQMAAFGECSSLSSITLPASLQSLKEIAFAYCPLESIVIPSSVTEIGMAAFGGCAVLEYASIEGAPAIGNEAFAQCTSLQSVYFYGNAPSSFGSDVFANTNPNLCVFVLQSKANDNSSGWKQFYDAHGGYILINVLPVFSGSCGTNVTWRLHGQGILVIEGTGAMSNFNTPESRPWNNYIQNVFILDVKEGVTSIGVNAMRGSLNLMQVLLPDSLTYIGECAFAQCVSMEQFHIPAGVGQSHWSFLLENPSLREITVDPANTYYSAEDGVLYANNKTILHTYPVCKTDEMFVVPESVEVIYSHAFSAFDARIGDVGSSYLKHIIIIGNIRELHNYAFAMNSSIENVVFLTNAPRAESNAFHYAYSTWNHINVYYPVSASGWDSIISTCQNGVQEWIPVKSVSLTGNTIMLLVRNDGIAELIGSGALWDEVSIPADIKEMILHFRVSEEIDYIGPNLFCDSPYAETITFLGTVPPECHSEAFDNMPSLHTVYVPVGYLSDYVDAFQTQDIALPLAEEGQTHSHTIVSGVWNVDETYHWQECTVCSAAIRKSPHSISGSAETCTACGIVPETISVVVSVTDMQITPGGDAAMTLSLTTVPENGLSSLILSAFWNPSYLTIIGTTQTNDDLPFAITNSLNNDMGMGGLIFDADSPITETGTLCTIFFHAADLDASEFPAAANMLNLSIASALSGTADLVTAITDYNIEITSPVSFTYEVNEDGTATISGFTGTPAGELVIPGMIDGYTVTAIGDYAFDWCYGFNGSLTIPDSVTSIGDYAFYECYGFTGSLTIPDSVTSIGDYAFDYCSGFTGALTIPDSVSSIGDYAFYSCYGFTGSLTIPASVSSVGDYAFYSCYGFTGSLTIPDGVTFIGEAAFCGLSNVNSIEVDENNKNYSSMEGILYNKDQTQLIACPAGKEAENFVISNSVTSIGVSAFAGCSGFTGSLTIPDGVTFIGEAAFYSCHRFSGSLTIPGGVTSIGNYAFAWCSGLESAHFEGDVPAEWGNSVFEDACTDFVICYNDVEGYGWITPTWTAPDGTVYNTAVYGTSEECVISVSDFRIEAGGTAEMTLSLTKMPDPGPAMIRFEIDFPADLMQITQAVNRSPLAMTVNLSKGILLFDDINSITTTGDLCTITFQASDFTAADLTNATLSVSVTECYDYQFNAISPVIVSDFSVEFLPKEENSITFTYTVNEDGTATITGYTGEQSGDLVIPGEIDGYTVTAIGAWAFGECAGFTGTLTIPDSVTSIGYAAFYTCSNFTGNLIIPDNVTYIGDYAFRNCSGFTGSLTIPNTVTYIGDEAFYGCSGFNGTLTISNSVTSIGNSAFSSCSGFTGSLTIPDRVTSIGDSAFSWCSGFTGSLNISDSVTSIGARAFQECSGFTGSLTIPDSVTSIGAWAFSGCSGFTGSLTIPDSAASIGKWAFQNCSGFTGSLTIPDSVTSVGDGAFDGCSGFTGSLTIPDSVTSIGYGAFIGCTGFTGTLTIPDSVTSIGEVAFAYCSGIESAYFEGDVPAEWGNSVFADMSADFIIYYNDVDGYGWTTPTWTAPDGTVYNTVAYGVPAESEDLNGDGTVNEADALYLLRHTLLPERYPLASADADYNGSGTVDARDAAFLMKKLSAARMHTLD